LDSPLSAVTAPHTVITHLFEKWHSYFQFTLVTLMNLVETAPQGCIICFWRILIIMKLKILIILPYLKQATSLSIHKN
jgi:hypothetical protein